MSTAIATTGDSRLSMWLRVRRFAVPPAMIETATARRLAGDWAGACAAAGFDPDLDMRAVAHAYGRGLASRLRAELRHLAPDLLRWHLPRVAPDGLLRPGLTIPLARYGTGDGDGPGSGSVWLVVRTPPAWASAGQRVSLALWDAARPATGPCRHPHARPSRRFRLDLHRHLWDARRAGELRVRCGADRPPDAGHHPGAPELPPALRDLAPDGVQAGRWAAEAAILLGAEGRSAGAFAVRFGSRRRLLLELGAEGGDGPPVLRMTPARPDRRGTAPRAPLGPAAPEPPVLPDAAVWTLPDLALLRTGSIDADRLHPLVADALAPDRTRRGGGPRGDGDGDSDGDGPDSAGRPRYVECRGARHRIALVDGVLAALDHDPAELRREELLVALTGSPLPCLQAIDQAHRRPDCLPDVRARIDHGDVAGALAVVEGLLGPDAVLRNGALRDALEAAARGRVAHGLFRAGLSAPDPRRRYPPADRPRRRR